MEHLVCLFFFIKHVQVPSDFFDPQRGLLFFFFFFFELKKKFFPSALAPHFIPSLGPAHPHPFIPFIPTFILFPEIRSTYPFSVCLLVCLVCLVVFGVCILFLFAFTCKSCSFSDYGNCSFFSFERFVFSPLFLFKGLAFFLKFGLSLYTSFPFF